MTFLVLNNMQLSQLVSIKKSIQLINLENSAEALSALSKSIDIGLLDIEQNYTEESAALRQTYSTLENNLTNVKDNIKNLLESIDKEILQRASHYCRRGSILDGIPVVEKMNAEAEIRTRIRLFPPEIKYDIFSIIRKFTSPQYPALELGPGNGQFTQYMVAGDPLYLVDINQEFLEKAPNQFTFEYRKRIRTYQIDAHGFGDNDLSCLPQNQFGFVLAIDLMDFYTWDFVSDYLKNIYNVLRPGGTLMFTYNNCEEFSAVISVERGLRGWATETDMKKTCIDIGYEIVETKNIPGHTYWAVVKKPGNLETNKIQQAMGEIVLAGS
jgi:SAM-dependent methyltransferase